MEAGAAHTASSSPAPFDLDELAGATGLATWMFAQFQDYVAPATVEIGPGVGTFTERLLGAGVERLLLVELDAALSDYLRGRFGSDPRVTIATEGLPESPAIASTAGEWGLVLCQNVLEHIEDDHAAAAAMASALRPGGHLVVLVPAHPRLYGALDSAYGHHRRYTRERLREVVEAAGLEVQDLYSFNLLGVAGWLAKRRSTSERLGARSLAAYERILKVWRPIEDRVRVPWGLSLIVVARRPG
jgi:SAM-dependent methyltransferase